MDIILKENGKLRKFLIFFFATGVRTLTRRRKREDSLGVKTFVTEKTRAEH